MEILSTYRFELNLKIFQNKYNTCGFDSFVQIMCTAVCDSDMYKTSMEELKNDPNISLLMELISDVLGKGVSSSTSYKKRVLLLKDIFPALETSPNYFRIDSGTKYI
uniref:Uncharacterized protein n=1 Tax=Cacopsylla melanoneura TaxID=428564 RepID=A0A8D8RVG2_9HEMI